jgi:hypothetical protein
MRRLKEWFANLLTLIGVGGACDHNWINIGAGATRTLQECLKCQERRWTT